MAATPYPDVNALLQELLTGVRAILGDHLVGVYLDGSLALGCFEPDRSDVDVVVVTEDELGSDVVEVRPPARPAPGPASPHRARR